MPAELRLLRHGETAGYEGDLGLSERGQAQAASNAPQGDLVDRHQENLSDCQQGLPPGEGHDK